ncbi:phage portal protein [Bacillus glycinifermentans]|uniref:Phage portal protein n=1 Tax=Bacillus glycinifermentans TaxID=1664069 RepID=A0A0T6BM05_9BACI|nr:phage portal protein [Bacillus glycinifermentans]ATH95168.1 phage portal protein [Bacillus glycinifermentans]KRT92689.1 phage portal protein [Bacillus glycinifermentans]MEC0487985.1 phage portal protein [Bacillus glycinifermentans]
MLIDRVFEKRSDSSEASGFNELINLFGGRQTASGEKVNERNSLVQPDVFACVNVLSDDIAKLPVHTYQKLDNGIERRPEHPVAYMINARPNPYMTAFTWKKLMMTHVLTWGNGYSYIEFDSSGFPKGLYPLRPDATNAYINPKTGMLWYQTALNDKAVELYDHQVLHFKGLSTDGIQGKSPVGVVREHIGAQAAATKYNAKLYKNDATPRGILKVPAFLDEKPKENVRKEWKRVNQGENIAIIDNGLEYQSISMPLQEAQFVESMKFNKAQIAMIYKVPLHKLNELDKATFSNIEHQSIEYVRNTLQPWIVNFEQELNVKLFTDHETAAGHYVKFNIDSELRGDSKTQAEYLKILQEIGALNRNEIRSLIERNPIEYGDKFMSSLNYVFLDFMEEYQRLKAGGALKGGDKKDEG